MARNPQDRYPTAVAMKQDLDHPEAVQVTGRADRLVVPSPISGNLRRYRLVAISILVPIIIFAVAWVMTHYNVSIKAK